MPKKAPKTSSRAKTAKPSGKAKEQPPKRKQGAKRGNKPPAKAPSKRARVPKARKGTPLPAPAAVPATATVGAANGGLTPALVANPPPGWECRDGQWVQVPVTRAYGRRALRRWYVLAVEPGTDRRVRNEIIRRKLINDMEDCIGRVLCPFEVKNLIKEREWEVVAEGEDPDANTAKEMARSRAWGIVAHAINGYCAQHENCDPNGYRTVIFPKKGVEKGKRGNGWTWQVKKEKECRKEVSVRELKYPGYVIIHCHYEQDTYHLIMKVRGVWNFLPVPLPMSNPPTLEDLKRRDEWAPTALDTEEAALVLIQQTEENKKLKEKPTELPFRVGDRVNVKDGAFANMSGPVLSVSGTERNSVVRVQVNLLGRDVPVECKVWQVEKQS